VRNRRRNNGFLSASTQLKALAGTKRFLAFLGLPIDAKSLTSLIIQTRQQHKNDDFTTDDALLRFVSQKPTTSYASWGAAIKGIFKANRTPLQASFNTTFTHSTKKIGSGILKALYESLDAEHQALIDLQAYAGERIAAICRLTPITAWEDFDNKYTLIHIRSEDTKARNSHICIIPKKLADWIRQYCKTTNRTVPFPNCETLWRDITKLALDKFGTRITSHYLRKRFHTIAGKTPMPVNEWDYLMGDRQSYGHNAGTYTLEDYSGLVKDYDRYLAPYLQIGNPKEPDEPKEPVQSQQLEQLLKENQELKEQIIKLSKLLMERFQSK
jgi:integrase